MYPTFLHCDEIIDPESFDFEADGLTTALNGRILKAN